MGKNKYSEDFFSSLVNPRRSREFPQLCLLDNNFLDPRTIIDLPGYTYIKMG